MSSSNNKKDVTRPAYTAPQVIRLDSVSTGAGANCPGGSAPTSGSCRPTGNGASQGVCDPTGNGARSRPLQAPTPK